MRFHELPEGGCFKRGKQTAIKTGPTTFQRVTGGTGSAKPNAKVSPTNCNIRPLIELGSVKRSTT